ncbi:hypothetical protein [Streptomyces sp. NPDC001640]
MLRKGVERFLGASGATLPATAVAAAGITGRASVVVMFAASRSLCGCARSTTRTGRPA